MRSSVRFVAVLWRDVGVVVDQAKGEVLEFVEFGYVFLAVPVGRANVVDPWPGVVLVHLDGSTSGPDVRLDVSSVVICGAVSY